MFRGLATVAPMGARFMSTKFVPKILITGATGQIGSELSAFFRAKYGKDSVICTDVKVATPEIKAQGPYEYLDVNDVDGLKRIVANNGVTWIIHLAALLSAVGEKNPQLALKVNVHGSENIIEVARQYKLRVYIPSTIGAFGPSTPKIMTPDETIMRPTTMYGVSKIHVELLGSYYNQTQGLDFRSLRYPGIISNKTLPGGGTTDYAIDIFYEAIKHHHYTCFLGPKTALPMMYMPDCLRCTTELIEADRSKLKQCVYNIAAVTFTPEEIAKSIKKFMPDFTIDYKPDSRQAIADSWPASLDDSNARKDWGWKEEYDLDTMTKDMLTEIEKKLKREGQI
ncbi:hypothetical protein WA158_003964 [Blastocystis sp. Blastoise]